MAHEAALAEANRIRTALGLEPMLSMPAGRKEEPKSCPLALVINHDISVEYDHFKFAAAERVKAEIVANLFDVEVEREEIYEGLNGPRWIVNHGCDAIEHFIHAFDEGEFPELDIDYEGIDDDFNDDADPDWF